MNRVGVAISLLGLCLVLSCDSEKDQYAGLGEMVAERQEVRKSIAEENARKKDQDSFWEDQGSSDMMADRKEEAVSSVVVYEKQIEILDSDSKLPLAKGVAYMNKSGQIVRIKVYRKK